MKKYILILAAALGFAACDKSEVSSAPFDDIIAGFDISQMDQVAFEQLLTTDALTTHGFHFYCSDCHRWDCSLHRLIGIGPSEGLILQKDGSCYAIYDVSSTYGYEVILPLYGIWHYERESSKLTVEIKSNPGSFSCKVVYFKYPKLILEGTGPHEGCIHRYEYHFGEMSKEDFDTLCKQYPKRE